MVDFSQILKMCTAILDSNVGAEKRLESICKYLSTSVEYYDWVGLYIVASGTEELILGPYCGEPTEHVRIPFGQGICGQAAENKSTFLIQDVSAQDNYLACSLSVKSEIVVPVFFESVLVGEIDIDSHVLSPFSSGDEEMLEELADRVAPLIKTIEGNFL